MINFKLIAQNLPEESKGNHEKSQSGWLASRSRIELRTSYRWSRSANHLIAMLSSGCVIISLYLTVSEGQTAVILYTVLSLTSDVYC